MADSALDRLTTALADRYRIQREAGAGGMATVYLADDLRHHRQVALKVLRPELAATMGPERFFREIRVAARLQHPHILPLHDSGESEGFLWFVMPFVTGESLRARLDRQGELPIGDAVRILVEVADALSHAHAQGVVHRDIKPDNVLLSGRHALVTDFGVARAVSEAAGGTTVTTAGVALGTPAYMAPEQAAADPQLDHRVDIYALGVLGYELLTGRTPFAGLPPAQTLAAHVSEVPQPIRRLREACPPGLEEVLMRCLAKRPADRWQSAEELLHALEPFAVSSGGTTPAQTRPTTGAVQGVRARTSRVAVLGGIGVGLALAAVAGWAALGGREQPMPVADLATVERVQLTSSGQASEPALSPDGTRLAYAERVCDSAGVCDIEVRVQDVSGAGSVTVARGFLGVGFIDWSADGRWLFLDASHSDQWGAFVAPALGGDLRYLGCCSVSAGEGGDTALVVGGPLVGDGPTHLRRVTASDGVIRDSLAIPRSVGGAVRTVWDIPGSDRMLIRTVGAAASTWLLMDRRGRVTDSLPSDPLVWARAYVRVTARGVVVARRIPPSFDVVDLVLHRFSGSSRFARDSVVLARGVRARGGLHVARDGSLVLADGLTEYAVWALERSSPTSTTFRQRLVARSTSPILGSITAAGDRLLLVRTRPNDQRVRDLSVLPFAGGTEVSLGPQRDVYDYDWHQDGRSVLLAAFRGRDSTEIRELDATTGRTRVLGAVPPILGRIETVAGGGYVAGLGDRRIAVTGVRARSDTVLRMPDEVGNVMWLEPSRDGREMITISWTTNADSMLVHRVSLVDGRAQMIATLVGEGAGAPTWLADGTLLFAVDETQWNSVWYMLPAGATRLVRLGRPPRADATYRFAMDGLRGVAREEVLRADIHLMKGLLAAVTSP